MVITCPTCGHQGKVDPSRIPSQGAKAKCPKCRNSFLIQRPLEQQPAEQQPAEQRHGAPAAPPVVQGPPATSPSVIPVPPQPPQAAPPPQRPQPPEPGKPELPPKAPMSANQEPSLGFADEKPSPAPEPAGGLSLQGPSAAAAAAKDVACTGCLKLFKADEVTRVGDNALCQGCQQAYQTKAQIPSGDGGRPVPTASTKKPRLEYAGFWVRAGAYAVDLFILFLVWHFVLSPVLMKVATKMMTDATVPLSMSFSQDQVFTDPAQMEEFVTQMEDSMNQMQSKMLIWVYSVNLAGLLLMAGYFIVLEGGSGQTLGKKALNLRVVTPEGDRIGYIKAFVRYVGKVVSWIILGIGFIMAAFDGEKRALHDRMCETRVERE